MTKNQYTVTRREASVAMFFAVSGFHSDSPAADAYPVRPVKVVIPLPPGGGADTLGRLIFSQLGHATSSTFVIDNRGGGGGMIGAAVVAKAPADGYSVLYDSTSHAINPSLYRSLSYDKGAFEPVFLAARVPNLLLVHPSINVSGVSELVAYCKAQTYGVNWASSGTGSIQHLALEMFKRKAGFAANHIPYKGGAAALADLLGGQVKFYFANAAAATGHVKAGSLKAIGHTGVGRLTQFPSLPAVADSYPGFEAYEWNGVFVPKGTPPQVVDILNAGLNRAITADAVSVRMDELCALHGRNTPKEFGSFVVEEAVKWKNIIEVAQIKPD